MNTGDLSTVTLASPALFGLPLPIVALPPSAFAATPLANNDPATRAAVDNKLTIALKNAIKREVGIDSTAVATVIDSLPLDYRTLERRTISWVVQHVVVPAMRKSPALADFVPLLERRRTHEDGQTVAELLQPRLPLAEHP